MFTESEIRFLTQLHIETADRERTLQPCRDLRELGCPARIFNRILEFRERKLGKAFAEFRAANKPAADVNVATQIDAMKLW